MQVQTVTHRNKQKYITGGIKNKNKMKIIGVFVLFGFLGNFKIGLRKDNNSATQTGTRK